jgi:type I restriction enzyme S subunit
VPLSLIQDGLVYHYSIPNFDETGGAVLEDGADIESAKQAVYGGEILISRLNPRKSRVILTKPHDTLAVCSGEFVVFRPRPGISPEYVCYLLQAETTRCWLDANVRSVTRSQQRVDPDIVKKMWVDLPTLALQLRLVAFLDAETKRIDTLIAEQMRLVDTLRERRLALITAAVAGQLDLSRKTA